MVETYWGLQRHVRRLRGHVTSFVFGQPKDQQAYKPSNKKWKREAAIRTLGDNSHLGHARQPTTVDPHNATLPTAARLRKYIESKATGLNKRIEHQTRLFHFLTWLRGHERIHFGPTCRLEELFQRRDQTYLSLSAEKLRWHLPPPKWHHEVFDVAVKVHKIETQIGYVFKDKLLCAEALKMSPLAVPLYFNGTVHPIPHNKRLALLGDRALSMAVCELWFYAGHSPKNHASMSQDTVTRANLGIMGRRFGLHDAILLHAGALASKGDRVAETFEAVLGAVYVDSGNSLRAVKRVIKMLGLDRHIYLQEASKEEEGMDVPVRKESSRAEDTLSEVPEDTMLTSDAEPEPRWTMRKVHYGGKRI